MTKESYKRNNLLGVYGSLGSRRYGGRAEIAGARQLLRRQEFTSQTVITRQSRRHTSPNKLTPVNLSPKVPPTGDQVFKCMSLWDRFFFKQSQSIA